MTCPIRALLGPLIYTDARGAIVGMADSLFKFVSALLLPAGVLLLIALGVGG